LTARSAGPSGDAKAGTEDWTSLEGGLQWFRAMALAGAVCIGLLGLPGDVGRNLPGSPSAAWARSTTSSGSRVNKDPVSLLQLALPIEELLGEQQVKPVRTLQSDVEQIKGAALLRLWPTAQSALDEASKLVSKQQVNALLKPVPADRRSDAEAVLKDIQGELTVLAGAIDKGGNASAGTVKDEDAEAAAMQSVVKCQGLIGSLEEMMVPADYAAPVPKDVDGSLPRLNGRATVEFKIQRPPGSDAKKYTIDAELYEEATFKVVCDGWSTPLTSGNIVDLVDRGFYKGMQIQRADGFIIQTGDTGAKAGHGFRPSPDAKVRKIPLEVAIRGKKQAIYGETADEAGLVGAPVKIPFQADGALSMAREEFDNDSGSSQFFFFLFESDMTPAGKNFLDGRYSSFGYTIEGADFLRQVQEGDIITSAKVISGMQNLKRA